MGDYRCSCGFSAATREGMADHLDEAFGPEDDRDAGGVRHAEAARDGSGSPAQWECLCGAGFGSAAQLDDHLRAAFTPPDRMGRDGVAHVPTDAPG